jgi:hypothetical protein
MSRQLGWHEKQDCWPCAVKLWQLGETSIAPRATLMRRSQIIEKQSGSLKKHVNACVGKANMTSSV